MKVYVSVNVDFCEDGLMCPRSLIWEDGHVYEIDKILDVRQAALPSMGTHADRYTIIIEGKRSCLYFERNMSIRGPNIGRWFVDKKEPDHGK